MSASLLSPPMANTITVDEALVKLGGFGLFQWLIYIGTSLAEMAVTYQIFLLTFIASEPKWVCKNGSFICNFSEPIGLNADDYKARCDMPRSEWEFAEDFTSIVTEVGNLIVALRVTCYEYKSLNSDNVHFKIFFMNSFSSYILLAECNVE